MVIPTWLPTRPASKALGCSPKHLKRQRDICGGFLEGGVHYILGSSKTASITWNVEKCRSAFHHRGLQERQKNMQAGLEAVSKSLLEPREGLVQKVNECFQIETALRLLQEVVARESKRHLMDEHLTASMRELLEAEIIPQLRNELDYDPTPQYLWDATGGEPPVTMDEMHTTAFQQHQEMHS